MRAEPQLLMVADCDTELQEVTVGQAEALALKKGELEELVLGD